MPYVNLKLTLEQYYQALKLVKMANKRGKHSELYMLMLGSEKSIPQHGRLVSRNYANQLYNIVSRANYWWLNTGHGSPHDLLVESLLNIVA